MSSFTSTRPTSFAPAARKDATAIKAELQWLEKELKRCSILDVLPDLILILNPERQVLFANRAVLNLFHLTDSASLLGRRPGEILGCAHAGNDSGGCGTTEFCRVCGAVNAILHTQRFHNKTSRECQIITTADKACNFRIWTTPFLKNNAEYTMMVLRDTTDEIYRNSLERIFFHDLINIGSGLYGLLAMMDDDPASYRENHQLLLGLAEELLEEISSQKDLLAAENGSMSVTVSPTQSLEIIKFIADMLSRHPIAEGKHIRLTADSENIAFQTDSRLLKRILINMTKNALEAAAPGDVVTLRSSFTADTVAFEVHNPGCMPDEVQLQIFNRSFSTKGGGRGLGTYSTKLLAEQYLQGKVYFKSTPELGTSFFVELPLNLTPPESSSSCKCRSLIPPLQF